MPNQVEFCTGSAAGSDRSGSQTCNGRCCAMGVPRCIWGKRRYLRRAACDGYSETASDKQSAAATKVAELQLPSRLVLCGVLARNPCQRSPLFLAKPAFLPRMTKSRMLSPNSEIRVPPAHLRTLTARVVKMRIWSKYDAPSRRLLMYDRPTPPPPPPLPPSPSPSPSLPPPPPPPPPLMLLLVLPLLLLLGWGCCGCGCGCISMPLCSPRSNASMGSVEAAVEVVVVVVVGPLVDGAASGPAGAKSGDGLSGNVRGSMDESVPRYRRAKQQTHASTAVRLDPQDPSSRPPGAIPAVHLRHARATRGPGGLPLPHHYPY